MSVVHLSSRQMGNNRHARGQSACKLVTDPHARRFLRAQKEAGRLRITSRVGTVGTRDAHSIHLAPHSFIGPGERAAVARRRLRSSAVDAGPTVVPSR